MAKLAGEEEFETREVAFRRDMLETKPPTRAESFACA